MIEFQRTPAHFTVAKLAEDMAQSVYEELCKSNVFYAQFHDRNATVKQIAPTLREEARSILAAMLQSNIDQDEKEQIFEALVLDHGLRPDPHSKTSFH